jgi:hypothetical protein
VKRLPLKANALRFRTAAQRGLSSGAFNASAGTILPHPDLRVIHEGDRMSHRRIFRLGFALFLGTCIGLTSCSRGPTDGSKPSLPTVTVSYPLQREVTDYDEFTGRTAAVDSVQVRARVSGYLEKINFKEMAEVKEGELLYEIDPRPYKAALEQVEAQVRFQEANVKFQEALYNRDLKLAGTQAVSQEELQKDLSAQDTARASLLAAKANVEQAQLNLNWTKIAAPMILSAINAMTLTPSRAVAIFRTEEGSQGREHQRQALPWWIFGVGGGLLAVWLAPKFVQIAAGPSSIFNLQSAIALRFAFVSCFSFVSISYIIGWGTEEVDNPRGRRDSITGDLPAALRPRLNPPLLTYSDMASARSCRRSS